MSVTIPARIVGLRGQCIQRLELEDGGRRLVMQCRRDERHAAVDHRTGRHGRPNRRLRRRIHDLPLMGRPLALDIEYFEVAVGRSDRRTEHLDFVGPGGRYTHRLAHLVSALCRHMNLSAVAHWTGLAWRTVKAMDRSHLQATLPALHPRDITGVRVLGVDEVARAKGHDYVECGV